MRPIRFIPLIGLLLAPLAAVGQSNPNQPPPNPDVAPPGAVLAQNTQTEISRPPTPPPPQGVTVIRTGGQILGGPPPIAIGRPLEGAEFAPSLGAWWKNSDIVAKLQLSEEQVRKISQTYLDHKLNLIDLQASLEKQELRLEPLMDIDQPDESKVGAQIDLITAARGKLEKENAMMMLDIRRWLSVEQWKKLKSLEAAEESKHNYLFIRRGVNGEGPPAPPLPDDIPADLRPR